MTPERLRALREDLDCVAAAIHCASDAANARGAEDVALLLRLVARYVEQIEQQLGTMAEVMP